jgi:hypothetical protein
MHTEDGGRSALFFGPRAAHLLSPDAEVFRAFVSAGKQAVLDLVPGACPPGQCRAAEKLRVIRMSQDDQDFLRGFPNTRGILRKVRLVCHRVFRLRETLIRIPDGGALLALSRLHRIVFE